MTTITICYYGTSNMDSFSDNDAAFSAIVERIQRRENMPYPFLVHVVLIVYDGTTAYCVDSSADELVIDKLDDEMLAWYLTNAQHFDTLCVDKNITEPELKSLFGELSKLRLMEMYHHFVQKEYDYESCTTPTRKLLKYFGFKGVDDLFTAGQLYEYVRCYSKSKPDVVFD